MCVRNCKKKFFLNECFGNKIGFGNLCNQEFKEKMENKDQLIGKLRSFFDKGKIDLEVKDLSRFVKYEVRNLKGEKKILKKKESCFEI